MTTRQKQWRIAKIVLAVVVLGILLVSVSISSVIETLKTVDLSYVVAAYGLNLIVVALMAYRWHILYAMSLANRPTYHYLLMVTFSSIFFNSLLPSSIGGDAYRVIHMSKYKSEGGMREALSIVFVDRVLGLLGLMLIGLSALAFSSTALPAGLNLWIGGLFAGLILLFIFSTNPQFHRVILKLVVIEWIQDRLASFFTQLSVFSERRALLTSGLIVSIVLRLVWILGCYFIGLALHLHLSIYGYLIAIPIIELVRMIPITVQGIGVREGLFVFFFGSFGISEADAVALALLIYLLLNINGLVGGLLFLLRKQS